MMTQIKHPLIKEGMIESRVYQEVIAARAMEKGNTLVVAPTALGKTVVAVLLAAHVLKEKPDAKILFLAPTKPLAVQHAESFRKFLNIPEEEVVLLTGTTAAKEREEIWKKARVISATPQTVENDVVGGRSTLGEAGLVIFDEAHRAVGDYAYVFIAKMYMKLAKAARVLALTASPGSEESKIDDVCRNLFIQNIEVKTPKDVDVAPYTQETDVDWVKVELPSDFMQVKKHLDGFIKEQMLALRKMGVVRAGTMKYYSKRNLLELQSAVRRQLAERGSSQPSLYAAVSRIASVLKVSHAVTLLETQGVEAAQMYFERMRNESLRSTAPKALKFAVADAGVQKAMALTEELFTGGVQHPKFAALKEVLLQQFKDNPEGKVLVFNHYRDSVYSLVNYLEQFEEQGIRVSAFIGQAGRGEQKGMSQKHQIEVLKALDDGAFNTLVCTSVAEEGLDIPACDLVVFFEPVPSEIRAIQRRGRTGRFAKGKVVTLVAKGTRDEAYYWSSIAKENKMHRTLKELKSNGEEKMQGNREKLPQQSTLAVYKEGAKDKVLIYADTREQASSVVRELMDKDCEVKVKQMDVGDYVLSQDVCVERKTVEDFLQSIIDGRLFNQVVTLASNYDKPLLILEGGQNELFTLRNIHKNSVIGALTSIALDYRVPVVYTKDAAETAEYLFVVAKREQWGKEKEIKLRIGRKGLTLPEQQRFIVESLPMVGPLMARKLLDEFGSVKGIANALSKDLQKVEGLGSKKAQGIKKVFWSKYEEE